jgi:hypothetical protein
MMISDSRSSAGSEASLTQSKTPVLIFCKRVVRIAIQPTLAGLSGRNNGMTGRTSVLAGMPVRRAVAAQRDAAFLTSPQVDPLRPDLYAFFAFAALGLFD